MRDDQIKRELERLQARKRDLIRLTQLRKEVASLELAKMVAHPEANILETVTHVVCKHFNIGLEIIMGRSKRQNICIPRWLIFYLAHQRGMSCSALGRLFDRNHTGILYAVKSIEDKMDVEPEFKALVKQLEQECCVASITPTVVAIPKSA